MNKIYHRNTTYYGKTTYIILEDGYALVMVSVMDDVKTIAVIHDLIVHDKRRGEGLGRELLEEACKEAVRMGAYVARLSVAKNSWLEEWYKRHGFHNVGIVEELTGHTVLQKDLQYEEEDIQ